MPNGDYAECPQCGFIAYGEEEIEEYFGYRYNGTKPQSWCRDCRSSRKHTSDNDDNDEDE